MFEFLFKYPPAWFERGVVELAGSWPAYAVLAALAGTVLLWGAGYLGGGGRLGRADRLVLMVLRALGVGAIVLALFQPVLVVTLPRPEPSHVAVALDDSRSMRIEDRAGVSRAAAQAARFAPGEGEVARRLEERFTTHYYRFAGAAEPLASGRALTGAGARSDVATVLRRVHRDLGDRALGAVILVGDGARGQDLAGALVELRALGVPVHTVGVGDERFAADLELRAASMPRDVLLEDTVDAEVRLAHRGLAGREVIVTAEADGLRLAERRVRLARDDAASTVRLPLRFTEAGPTRLAFRAALASDAPEAVVRNNAREFTVRVRTGPVRVLHLEGEPRFEVKFIRRAVVEDPSIELASIVRTAENKFYRLGLTDPEIMPQGLPDTAEALFAYQVLVLGSLEARQLSEAQQALITDFVAERGGGLLVLGGRFGLAEGGLGSSRLARLLPVNLGERAAGFRAAVEVQAAPGAGQHPALRGTLETRPDLADLPPLTVLNPVREAKPGATVLLRGDDGDERPLVIFAYHRYGRGTVAVLPVANTWRWQMHNDVPLEDQTHETLWRQLLRWLARSARERVSVSTQPASPVPGEAVTVQARVLDTAFRPRAGASASVEITTPLGDHLEHALDWSSDDEGLYTARFTPAEPGVYELRVRVQEPAADATGAGSTPVPAALAFVDIEADGDEFFGAELDAAGLRRIAAATGGRYFDLDDAGALPQIIDAVAGQGEIRRRLDLWDAPVLFLLVLVAACGEWFYRRWRGLA